MKSKAFFFHKDLVCKETVMLHWWKIETRKLGIKQERKITM